MLAKLMQTMSVWLKGAGYFSLSRDTVKFPRGGLWRKKSGLIRYGWQGGGGYTNRPGGLMIGGEGGGGGRIIKGDKQVIVVGSGSGFANLGRQWKLSDGLWITPLLGIGGRGKAGVVSDKRDLTPGQVVATDPAHLTAVARGGPALHLGLLVEMRFGRGSGLLVAAQLGYCLGLFQGRAGAPARDPYLRLHVGFYRKE